MSDYSYNFDAEIVKHGSGKVQFSVVYLPKEILSQLDFSKSHLRIDGEIQGIRIEVALMPTKGKSFLVVSKKLQKLCGVSLGDFVSVSFDIADKNAITVPIELQYALEANDAAREVWDSWAAGRRRSFCYRVDSAKMVVTRERHVEELIDLLMAQAKRTSQASSHDI